MTESPDVTSFSRVKRERKSTIEPQRMELIIRFIHEFKRINGFSPIYEEIAEGIGYGKKSGGKVHTMIQKLIAEGWLTGKPKTARTLQPIRPETEHYCTLAEPRFKQVAKLQAGLKILK